MRVSKRRLVVALACLSNIGLYLCLSNLAAAQPPDQVVAERVLGPQWKQLSRRAGMIFAGMVLAAAPSTGTTQPAEPLGTTPGTAAEITLSFRVDTAIAGVQPGQVLTIHEWAGARNMYRPMMKGQHVLIFLYPLSRLGLTSPVGGALGQIALDQTGKNVAEHDPQAAAPSGLRNASSPQPRVTLSKESVSVLQLERAIRSAREE